MKKRAALLLLVVFMAFGVLIGCQDDQQQDPAAPAPTQEPATDPADDPMTDPADDPITDPANDSLDEPDTVPAS